MFADTLRFEVLMFLQIRHEWYPGCDCWLESTETEIREQLQLLVAEGTAEEVALTRGLKLPREYSAFVLTAAGRREVVEALHCADMQCGTPGCDTQMTLVGSNIMCFACGACYGCF